MNERQKSQMRIGVDLGGTEIKIGVVDADFNIVKKLIGTTPKGAPADTIADAIAEKCRELMSEFDIVSIGVGTPGIIKNGKVNASNLSFDGYPLAEEIEKRCGIPTKIANDANCAALAEAGAGAAKDVQNCILLTLGTGVGGGIIINKSIYEGKGSGGELGHFIIEFDGIRCPCGLNGCFEQYASTTALVRLATDAAKNSPESILGTKYASEGTLNGIMIFDSVRAGCPVANAVLDKYTDYLAAGINSLVYIFDPDVIVISGGISNAGPLLIDPVTAKVKFDIPIRVAEHKNDAGTLGASML